MFILLFLHIGLMVSAVTLSAGTSAILFMAHRAGRLAEVWPLLGSLPIEKVIPPLFLFGGLAGLATAISFGTSLVSPWLLIAYAGAILGGTVSPRLIRPIFGGLARSTDEATLEAAVGREVVTDFAFTVGLFGLLIADMVFKPFS